MNVKNTEKLIEKYPEMYRGHTKPVTESLMCFGFECGDGWFELLDNLSNEITEYCKKEKIEFPEVFQVKEKFGGLRFYLEAYEDDNDGIEKLIDTYEILSENTCELCGKPGILSNEGWVSCRCPKCKKKKD